MTRGYLGGETPHPFGEERLEDRVGTAPVARDELRVHELTDRALDARRRRKAVPRPVFVTQRPSGRLRGERLQDEPLRARDRVPDVREVRVLGAEDTIDRALDGRICDLELRFLPDGVTQLLRPVRVAAGDSEDRIRESLVDALARRLEPLLDEPAKLGSRNRAEPHLPSAAPEGLVHVVEEGLHHAPLAPEVDVRDVRLRSEERRVGKEWWARG